MALEVEGAARALAGNSSWFPHAAVTHVPPLEGTQPLGLAGGPSFCTPLEKRNSLMSWGPALAGAGGGVLGRKCSAAQLQAAEFVCLGVSVQILTG